MISIHPLKNSSNNEPQTAEVKTTYPNGKVQSQGDWTEVGRGEWESITGEEVFQIWRWTLENSPTAEEQQGTDGPTNP